MRKLLLVNENNVCGLYCNLSRAYEIAMLGNFTIRLIKGNNVDNHEPSDNDLKMISNLFTGVDYVFENDYNPEIVLEKTMLHIELTMPNFEMILTNRKSELISDVLDRVNKAKDNVKPEFKLSEGGRTLFKTAFERLKLSFVDLESIAECSRVIAQLHGSKDIKIEYLAEAIQYHSYGR